MTEFRTFAGTLEIREGGRTITGMVVPVGRRVPVGSNDYPDAVSESFAPGSIDTSEPSELLLTHPAGGARLPIASGDLAESKSGFFGRWPVDDSDLGNAALGLVRSGKTEGLSVGFRSKPGGARYEPRTGHVTRTSVLLDHVALVERGAYPDAKVLSVRAAGPVAALDCGWADCPLCRPPERRAPGDRYADPGYLRDGQQRYPLDTAADVRRAWADIQRQSVFAWYSDGQLATVRRRIIEAAARHRIGDLDGDPVSSPAASVSRVSDPAHPYGAGITYGDPGYQADKKARYPLDTAEHVRSAISYFSQAPNREPYTSDQVTLIWARIRAAAKRFGIEMTDEHRLQLESRPWRPGRVPNPGVALQLLEMRQRDRLITGGAEDIRAGKLAMEYLRDRYGGPEGPMT